MLRGIKFLLIVVILVQWWAVSLVKAVPFAGKKNGADTGIDWLDLLQGLSWWGRSRRNFHACCAIIPARENLGGILEMAYFVTLKEDGQPPRST